MSGYYDCEAERVVFIPKTTQKDPETGLQTYDKKRFIGGLPAGVLRNFDQDSAGAVYFELDKVIKANLARALQFAHSNGLESFGLKLHSLALKHPNFFLDYNQARFEQKLIFEFEQSIFVELLSRMQKVSSFSDYELLADKWRASDLDGIIFSQCMDNLSMMPSRVYRSRIRSISQQLVARTIAIDTEGLFDVLNMGRYSPTPSETAHVSLAVSSFLHELSAFGQRQEALSVKVASLGRACDKYEIDSTVARGELTRALRSHSDSDLHAHDKPPRHTSHGSAPAAVLATVVRSAGAPAAPLADESAADRAL